MPTVRTAVVGFFPLDEELALLPGSLTPSLVESTVRLGAWMPFPFAAKMLSYFTKADISEPTARRITEKAGQAYGEVQTAQVEVLEKELPESPPGPAIQLLSVDGAMVPLVHKEWAEVKTLALGTVGQPVLKEGQWHVHTTDLSYFSRLADHESFARLATVETHRRGTEKARIVCAPVDGAEWQQKFIDYHRPDAVRILDWGHAAEYLGKVAQAVFGEGKATPWLETQLRELKDGDPQKVLGKLRGLREELAAEGEGRAREALEVVSGSLEYLEKRQEQIRYAEFQAKGYPIGSGAVESANKLVVEERLKGAGMHWARVQVNPMVALRTIACSDRWEEAWAQISARFRQEPRERSEVRRKARKEKEAESLSPKEMVAEAEAVQEPAKLEARTAAPIPAVGRDKPSGGSKKPAANHVWRHMPIGKARFNQTKRTVSAES
jgi:hypothetical protein